MEVTIDEARNMLMIIENSTESLKTAIEIMRKYQKIEEIVKQYKKFGNIDFSMQIISGVVEDGRI